MTIDDFEWVERGFDNYLLMLKGYEFPVAHINNFNGWKVQVWRESTRNGPLVVNALDLDAAKAVALIYANKHMEKYDAHFKTRKPPFSKRAPEYRPEAVPKGVFKMDRVRS